MKENKDIESVLHMTHCVFDDISFRRNGFQNDNETEFKLGANIKELDEHEYCVTLLVNGTKTGEYDLDIRLSGYFYVADVESIEVEKQLIKSNAVAILLPYMRSQVSILTSQPETRSEMLPIINVYNLVEDF